jgi:metal-responsive CopG/Arc/MetJ family transcriptional regulator
VERPHLPHPGLAIRYNESHAACVKTAVSIPDPLFAAAEVAAEELGVSRSALYSRALRRFLARYRQRSVTERLNSVYEHEKASADQSVLRAQWKRVRTDAEFERW